jgi:hypothetical protein
MFEIDWALSLSSTCDARLLHLAEIISLGTYHSYSKMRPKYQAPFQLFVGTVSITNATYHCNSHCGLRRNLQDRFYIIYVEVEYTANISKSCLKLMDA